LSEIFLQYPDLLGVKHLMEIFGVGKNTIYRKIRDGEFGKPIKMGKGFKIPKQFVWNKFIEQYK